MTVTKQQVLVKKPSGDEPFMEIYLADDDLARCDDCGAITDASDWTSAEYFDAEDLGSELLPTDRDALHAELLSKCQIVTRSRCPNCGEELDDEQWWPIEEDRFVCTNDNEWYNESHYALVCCGNCHNDPTEFDNCYCIDMVETDEQGRIVLFSGLPLARCRCGRGRCDKVVCLVCHDAWIRNGQGMRHATEHVQEHLKYVEVVYADGATVVYDYNVKPRVAKKTVDCPICGTYCCSIHHTHAATHTMCWEAQK